VPLSLEVSRARLTFSGSSVDEILLRGATLRAWGLPVLPLPWLLLRSERHWGLLPPRAALRARDGVLVGAGVHAPLGSAGGLSLEPALYLRGGHEVLATARLREGTVGVRWDRRGQDLLAVSGQGRVAPKEGAVLWSVDAVRGPRARPGTIDLEAAARPYDQGKLAWVVPWAGSFSSGVRGFAPRGEGAYRAGPQVSWSGSSRGGSVSWWADGLALGQEGGAALSLARSELRLGRAWWWGPLRLRPEARLLGSAGAGGEPGAGWASLRARGVVRADVPLLRRGERSSWLLSPGVQAGALGSRRAGEEPEEVFPGTPPESAAFSSVFIRNFWVHDGGSVQLVPEVAVLRSEGGWRPVGRGQLAAEGGWLRAALEGATTGAEGSVAAATLEAGRAGGWRGTLRIEGQQGRGPVESRWLREEGPWVGGWFERPVWSGEAGAGVGGWMELTGARWLGHRMDFLYESPCRCLRVGLHGSTRLGREGVDLWGTLTLG
jgi:hypothetical protein